MNNLVCYYSLEGNTDFVARKIAEKTNAELLEVKPVNELDGQSFKKYLIGGFQSIVRYRPDLQEHNFSDDTYDHLFLGSPVWAGSITPPIRSFLHNNSLNADKIVLFSTYQSSKGKVFDQMKQFIDQNKVVDEIGFSQVLNDKEKNLEILDNRISGL